MNNILNYALFDNRIKLFWSPFECLNELLLSFRDGQIQVYSLPVTKFTPVHFQKLWSYFQILFWKICFCKFIVILLFSGMLWLKSHSADFSILPKMDSVELTVWITNPRGILLKFIFVWRDYSFWKTMKWWEIYIQAILASGKVDFTWQSREATYLSLTWDDAYYQFKFVLTSPNWNKPTHG